MNTSLLPTLPLRDIHLPPDIAWWPLAMGWWYLLGGVILLAAAVGFWRRWYQKKALRREALAQLHRVENTYRKTGNRREMVAELSVLLRRVVLSTHAPEQVAGLTGEAWLTLLDRCDASNQREEEKERFTRGTGRILATAPYQKEVSRKEADDLLMLCRDWIQHR